MKDKPKILLIAGKGASTNIVFHFLKDHFNLEKVILENSVSKRKLIKNRIKKLGIVTVIGQLIFQVILVPIIKLSSVSRCKEILSKYNLVDSPIAGENIVQTNSINSKEAIDQINSISPDLIIVSGCRIISKKVLTNVPCHFINLHAGITPQYRGVHGGYWALQKKKKEDFGVTLHRIDAGIDTGKVIAQRKISVSSSDNFTTYPFLQLAEGLDILRNHLNGLPSSFLKTDKENSAIFYHPTAWGYLYDRIINRVK